MERRHLEDRTEKKDEQREQKTKTIHTGFSPYVKKQKFFYFPVSVINIQSFLFIFVTYIERISRVVCTCRDLSKQEKLSWLKQGFPHFSFTTAAATTRLVFISEKYFLPVERIYIVFLFRQIRFLKEYLLYFMDPLKGCVCGIYLYEQCQDVLLLYLK